MAVINARSLTKAYQDNLVLSNLSFTIEKGRFYTILGLNGSGKSTLINLLSSRTLKDKSDVEIFGVKLGEELGDLRRKIASVNEKMTLGTGVSI